MQLQLMQSSKNSILIYGFVLNLKLHNYLGFISLSVLKAVRIVPTIESGSGSIDDSYSDYTFDLSFGSSEASTLVTFPSGTLSKLAQDLTKPPVLQATVVGGRLSLTSNEDTSQVFWCLLYP